MKLNQYLKTEIIKRAKNALDSRMATEKTSFPKSKKQNALDAFFATKSNDPYWVEVSKLVSIITDYQPAMLPVKAENFQIMIRPITGGNPISWIILKSNMYGFATSQYGYHILTNVDRPATLKEADDFIKVLEEIDADVLGAWIIKSLGVDTITSSFLI